jgi:hypothetical protein
LKDGREVIIQEQLCRARRIWTNLFPGLYKCDIHSSVLHFSMTWLCEKELKCGKKNQPSLCGVHERELWVRPSREAHLIHTYICMYIYVFFHINRFSLLLSWSYLWEFNFTITVYMKKIKNTYGRQSNCYCSLAIDSRYF